MAKYRGYPSYKSVDIAGVVEVPEHWSVKPLKRMCTYNDEVLSENTDPDTELEYVDISSVSATEGIGETSALKFSNAPSRARRRVRDGDVLVSTVRTYLEAIARVGNPPKNMVASTGFAVIRPNGNSLEKNFAGYALRARYFIDEVVSRSVGVSYPAINASELVAIKLPLPTHEEQRTIADFLDHETAKIDNLIARQERLIELLKEKRQAVISHAVTKGLNPDAPMKDSGVEWLGEVPAHWDVEKSKRLFRLVAEPAPENNNYELLSVYTDIGVKPRRELEQKGNKASTTDGYWLVKKGDIIVNKLLAWMGAVGYSGYKGVTSPAYDILRKVKPLNPRFYHYLFRTKIAQTEFKRWSRGIMEMRLRLYFDQLGNIYVPFPPPKEQDSIVETIENLEKRFEKIIEKSKYSISLLQEHRTALISAAITGKIDVRDWQKPEQHSQQTAKTATG